MCGSKSLVKSTKLDCKIDGLDLGNLVGETTGNTERDLAKSRENTNSEAMIPIQLNHIPGIQK